MGQGFRLKRSAISIAICIAMVAIAIGCGWNGPDLSFAESSTDVYFGTEGTPQGPAAPTPHETVYPRVGSLDSRVLVWFVTQQHTYFGGFVLALPLFCALLEVSWINHQEAGLGASLRRPRERSGEGGGVGTVGYGAHRQRDADDVHHAVPQFHDVYGRDV